MQSVRPVHPEFSLSPTKPLPYYPEPKNDNQRLLNYQYDYKIKGDKSALAKMYQLGAKVAARFIANIAESQKKIAQLRRSEREEKAHNAITYMITRYLRVKDFAITESFTAYLYLRVKHELFYQRKVDTIVDFVDWESYRGANDET